MDRRVRKSQRAILEAFVGLLAEKDFAHITMNDIAERADVNRGTVYLHYVDKFDLLDHCIDTHLAHLLEDCLPGGTLSHPTKAALLRVFAYLEQHAFLYSTLLVNKGIIPTFRNRLMAVMVESLRAYFDASGIPPDMNKEVSAQFLASAAVGVLEWWITQSMPYSPTEMVEHLWALGERVGVPYVSA
ncbi:MAG TPA: TetR/AcrR family transcriptional regulator [Ktedonobacterales bacterium]|nr:TetR/AcrR family transcriptional regulator [Ktedonobacterales bacterium]